MSTIICKRANQIIIILEGDGAGRYCESSQVYFVNEASFNLAKIRCSGRKFIGQRATIQVPGQRGGTSQCVQLYLKMVW